MNKPSHADEPIRRYRDAPTRSLSAAGVNFAYRELASIHRSAGGCGVESSLVRFSGCG
jgi:hypothetical protein